MTEELKPCPVPWCSNEGAETVWQPFARASRVVCQSCRCHGPLGKTEADAIAAWNARASSPELTQLVKAARELADFVQQDVGMEPLAGSSVPGEHALGVTLAALASFKEVE